MATWRSVGLKSHHTIVKLFAITAYHRLGFPKHVCLADYLHHFILEQSVLPTVTKISESHGASPHVFQDIMIRFVYIKFELGVIELTYTPDLHPTVGTLTNRGSLQVKSINSADCWRQYHLLVETAIKRAMSNLDGRWFSHSNPEYSCYCMFQTLVIF